MAEDQDSPRKNGPKTIKGRFTAGNSGRPKGARHKTTLAVEALMAGQAEALTQRAISAALDGDSTALRLCLERISPASKDRTVAYALPPIATAQDAPIALAAVIQGVAKGLLSPSEAANMAALVDRWRAAFETSELERRMAALEEKAG